MHTCLQNLASNAVSRFCVLLMVFLCSFMPLKAAHLPLDTLLPNQFLSLEDAQKVIGDSCMLSENKREMLNGILTYHCAYTSIQPSVATRKPSLLTLHLEDYQNDEDASRAYAVIRKSLQSSKGLKVVRNLGDEAYFHTDGVNRHFAFIFVRQHNRLMRLRLTNLGANASFPALMELSRKIIAKV
jgi:hypothetical protein